ncbi:MAG: MarR family winged helix-turn-helix transcriptional regulator [Acetivibrionales bacterium]|jgi:DNA-binding MarR family transcriptional regulator
MSTEWMGRYRELTSSLVMHCNIVSKVSNQKSDIGEGVKLTPLEWQILERVIEWKDEYYSMTDIAKTLGIPQSSFSRFANTLKRYQLIEKYRTTDNKKSVILRPTEKAERLYSNSKKSGSSIIKHFKDFYAQLDSISDEDLNTFVKALKSFSVALAEYSNNKSLIKIEE